jgi:hypothetical protein
MGVRVLETMTEYGRQKDYDRVMNKTLQSSAKSRMKRAIGKLVKQRDKYKKTIGHKMAQFEHRSGQRMKEARQKLQKERAEKEKHKANRAAQVALTGLQKEVVQKQAPQCKHCGGTDHQRSSSKQCKANVNYYVEGTCAGSLVVC